MTVLTLTDQKRIRCTCTAPAVFSEFSAPSSWYYCRKCWFLPAANGGPSAAERTGHKPSPDARLRAEWINPGARVMVSIWEVEDGWSTRRSFFRLVFNGKAAPAFYDTQANAEAFGRAFFDTVIKRKMVPAEVLP